MFALFDFVGGAIVFGSVAFWVIIALFVFLEILFIEKTHTVFATFVCMAFFWILAIGRLFNIFTFVKHQPVRFVEIILIYVFIGCIWGIIKWWRFVSNVADKVKDELASFMRGYGVTTLTPELKKEWTKLYAHTIQPPMGSQNKELIISWMMYWPFSMIWTMIDDPIKKLFQFLYRKMGGIFDHISKMVWKDVGANFAANEDIENKNRKTREYR